MDSSEEEFVYETDEEAELEDLRKLEAALTEDEAGPSRSLSQFSINTKESTCDSSQDDFSNLDTAIALNKLYDQKLEIFERKLRVRLQECRKRFRDLHSKVLVPSEPPFYYSICGKPFFKDKSGKVPPENNDTRLRKEAGMYDFSDMETISGWTLKDKSSFTKLILKMSRKIKLQELRSQLSDLVRAQRSNNADVTDQIEIIKNEISEVPKKTMQEVALPIDYEYDWYLIANTFNWKHKPEEFRALWRLFLHPSINKKKWSKSEHVSLLEIASKMNFQGWDKIAEQLNTNRSPYQCFVYYRTNMSLPSYGRKWTRQEEEYLKRLIDYYRIENYIPWAKVVACMENRTKNQVYNKYIRLSEERKGRFLPEEDAIILTFADKHGPDFKRMQWYLPGRSLQQCRERYYLLSTKKISKSWTVEEDKKLLQLMAGEEPLRNFSKLSKHFPDKDRINIRTRYLTLEKWMMMHPNLDIANAPRRSARTLNRGRKIDNLNVAITNLKQRMESELLKKKKEAVTEESNEEEIEEAIIKLLFKEQLKIEESAKHKLLPKPKIKNDHENHTNNNLVMLQTKTEVNVKHLRQVLLLLRAKLSKKKFEKSLLGKSYAELLDDDRAVFLPPVKSYSRKAPNIAKDGNIPDIWGNQMLCSNMDYVLPPNYSTIIGSNLLMNFVSESLESSGSLKKCLSHNSVLRKEMQLLLSRFYTLFLWPMILSNHKPPKNVHKYVDEEYLGREAFAPVVYKKENYNFVVPIDKNEIIVNDVIDLPEDSKKEETVVKLTSLDEVSML